MEQYKKIKEFLENHKNPILIIVVVIIMVVYFTPFKRLTQRFDTAEQAFSATQKQTVIDTIDFDGGSFVIYGDKVILGDYVVKDDKGYVPPEKRFFKSSKAIKITNAQVTRFNDGKSSFIKVFMSDTQPIDTSKIVTPDGFKYFETEADGRYYYFWTYCGINVAKNYDFSFNGEDISI